jgi:CHAD domain-containing protein
VRVGPDWLLDRLRARKAQCDAALRHVIDDEYDRAVERVERGLVRYTASVLDADPAFAPAFAQLVHEHMDALVEAIGRVASLGDRAEAHGARIAAKRLRYLVEAVADDDPTVGGIIGQLKTLQDTLGELHDTQIFASEIAGLQSDVLAAQLVNAAIPEPRVAGLHVLARRLRRRETQAFSAFVAAWTPSKLAAFASRVSALAGSIRDVGP